MLLEIEKLTKTYPGVVALDHVDFQLNSGEIHCLIGENGAGKSTFIKIVSGATVHDSGKIYVDGILYNALTPHTAMSLGIQTVYQESVLVGTLTASENIFLGNEDAVGSRLFDKRKATRLASELIESLNMEIDPIKYVEDMSTAERQLLGIAKAFSRKAKILILDEPTASLSASETKTLMLLLNNLVKNKKIGIIYISHHLEEVFDIADTITVFKDGKKVNTHNNKNLSYPVLIQEMVGRPAEMFYVKEKIERQPEGRNKYAVQNLTKPEVVEDISFSVESGTVFGIGGMVGSGRTELLRLLFGLDGSKEGKVLLNGRDITPSSPLNAIKSGVCLITEDRQKSGLVLNRSIKENIALPKLNIEGRLLNNIRQELLSVNSMIYKMRIVSSSLEQEVEELSGGNQQKVVLAKWLLVKVSVYLFDEPTRGIDIGAKEEIYKLITELVKQNKIVIIVSSDMPELIALSDRIGVMRNGKMIKILEQNEITDEAILSYSIGVQE